MLCPRCNIDLIEGTSDEEEVNLCQKCSGALIKQKMLIPILKKVSGVMPDKVDENTFLPRLNDIGAVAACPDCKSQMEHYGYMGSNIVMIDGCNECNWIWVDARELVVMAKLYTQSNLNYERSRANRMAKVIDETYINNDSKESILEMILFDD